MKIYFDDAIKLLSNKNNFLVGYEYNNGIIRNRVMEEEGMNGYPE